MSRSTKLFTMVFRVSVTLKGTKVVLREWKGLA